jgi:WD40 repeat protein
MWNPFTGKIKNVYEDPMQNEVTALAIDKNMKRAFLGDNTGKIKCYNLKNGKFLKDLTSHNLEINMLVHSLDLNIVVSCSVDNVIKIHDDRELVETMMIKEIKILGYQVKAIGLMDHLWRLAIGLSNGLVKFYDIDHFRFDSDLHSDNNSNSDEVTCIHPFVNTEVLFTGTASGLCKFMLTPPNAYKFFVFNQFYNLDENDQKNYIPITCMDFDYGNKRMFCGDQRGVLKCFDLKELFSLIEGGKLDAEFIEKAAKVKINKLWHSEGHKESIKHIHYTE